MDRRHELVHAEEQGWAELVGLLEGLSPAQLEEPGLSPDGWSVKDLMFHVGCWSADCAHVLERIRMGTFEEPEIDIDAVNREWFEVSRTLDLATVRAELMSGRNRMLQEWAALEEITLEADSWFEESGPIHYADHAGDLRRWVERLTSGG